MKIRIELEPGERMPSKWRVSPTHAFWLGLCMGLFPTVVVVIVLLAVTL